MTSKTIIAKSRPNGHYLAIIEEKIGDRTWYVVSQYVDGDEDEVEFDTLAEAQADYDESRKILAETPNWEAQAAYDEMHGDPYYHVMEE